MFRWINISKKFNILKGLFGLFVKKHSLFLSYLLYLFDSEIHVTITILCNIFLLIYLLFFITIHVIYTYFFIPTDINIDILHTHLLQR